ncbi:MAG: alkaline phosphatase family protein [Candidatus Hodarchaeota archaeon]
MKILILAYDGLDFNLIIKYKLKNILQKINGQISVSNFEHLLTPVIWCTFITGELPEKHGVKGWWTVSSDSKVDLLFYWIWSRYRSNKVLSRAKLRRILNFFGIKIMRPDLNFLKRKGLTTIFDLAQKPIALDVPSYNERMEIRERYSQAIEKGLTWYENEIWNIHLERKERLFNELDSDWDLLMAWFDVADLIQHLYLGRSSKKIFKVYFELDKLTHEILKYSTNDTIILIISDHGMKLSRTSEPVHREMAFYSLNKELGWRPIKFTDYADFIIKTIYK